MTRFVVSMTTIPKRLPYIKPVIKSILKHNPDIDKLYICIPYGEVDPRFIPMEGNKIKIIRCKDYGPITKILGMLDYEKDPETLILTLDDDTLITQNFTKILKNKAEKYPNAALSFSGWCYGYHPFKYQLILNNTKDAKVDWIQGVHGILYRRKFINLKEIQQFELNHPLLFKNDDHRLSAYLESKKINRISINKNPIHYFKNYQAVSGIDAISGNSLKKSVKFWYNVTEVCEYLKKRGFYYRVYDDENSIIFIILLFILLSLILLILGISLIYCYNLPWLYFILIALIVIFFIWFVIKRYKKNKFLEVVK